MKLQELPRSALAGGAVLLFLVGWMVYGPLTSGIQQLNRERDQLISEREEARRLADRFYGEKIPVIPKAARLPEILETLHEHARRCGVEIRAVSPGPLSDSKTGEPVHCSVELQLEGDYRSLGELLTDLRDSSEFGWVSIRHLQIAREEGILPRLRAQLSIEVALQ